MTPQQSKALRFIVLGIDTKGYPPTYREIMRHCGMSSTSQVFTILIRLEEQGYIKRRHNRERGIEVLRRPAPMLAMDARQHLMWGMETDTRDHGRVVQALTLAFMPDDARKRLQLDPTTKPKLVRVRVTIEKIEETD